MESIVGGVFFGIRNSTLMGCRSELGGSPLANSIAVIPNDQMSAWKETKRCKMVRNVSLGTQAKRNSTLMGCRSELGGSPLANSIAVIPNDQMSAWKETKRRKMVRNVSLGMQAK